MLTIFTLQIECVINIADLQEDGQCQKLIKTKDLDLYKNSRSNSVHPISQNSTAEEKFKTLRSGTFYLI